MVPRKRVKSKFLYQDADVILLADKCIVIRSFVCMNYDKVLMETGRFSDNLRVTENGLVSGVDRAFKSSNYKEDHLQILNVSPFDYTAFAVSGNVEIP